MTDDHAPRARYGEAFWRTHHEAWKRSDLIQREYCESQGLSLKAFGNWRAKFKSEPEPPARKLLYRRGRVSHRLSHTLSPTPSHVTYPSSEASPDLIVPPARPGHRRRFSETDRFHTDAETLLEVALTCAKQAGVPTAAVTGATFGIAGGSITLGSLTLPAWVAGALAGFVGGTLTCTIQNFAASKSIDHFLRSAGHIPQEFRVELRKLLHQQAPRRSTPLTVHERYNLYRLSGANRNT